MHSVSECACRYNLRLHEQKKRYKMKDFVMHGKR